MGRCTCGDWCVGPALLTTQHHYPGCRGPMHAICGIHDNNRGIHDSNWCFTYHQLTGGNVTAIKMTTTKKKRTRHSKPTKTIKPKRNQELLQGLYPILPQGHSTVTHTQKGYEAQRQTPWSTQGSIKSSHNETQNPANHHPSTTDRNQPRHHQRMLHQRWPQQSIRKENPRTMQTTKQVMDAC